MYHSTVARRYGGVSDFFFYCPSAFDAGGNFDKAYGWLTVDSSLMHEDDKLINYKLQL
jgi:hypothetical protein